MDRVKVAFLRYFMGYVNAYGLTDIDASKAKRATYAHKSHKAIEEQEIIRQQAVKIGIEKLKQMKEQID